MADKSGVLIGFGVGAAASLAVAGGMYLLRSRSGRPAKGERTNGGGTGSRRHLKLYHSFPFRSSRCAWVINELGIEEFIEVVPVSLHGPDSKDLHKYKAEVCTILGITFYTCIPLNSAIDFKPYNTE